MRSPGGDLRAASAPGRGERALVSPLLAERFAARAAATPDAVAVRDRAGAVTYGELAASAAAVAHAVAGARRIALLPRSDAVSLAVTLGAMGAGVSVVLLHRHVTAGQLARVAAVAAPAFVVAGRAAPGLFAGIEVVPAERLVAAGASLAVSGAGDERRGSAAEPLRSARPGDELLVGLTSGTSGEPKLFVRDQASWAATLDRSDAAFDVRPGDVVSVPGPLDHTHFLYGALHALTRGAAVDLRPLADAFAEEPTHVYLVPALAADLAELLDGRPRPGVREVASSSADWAPEARARLATLLPNAEILHFYGASELSFVALDRWPAGSSADLGPIEGHRSAEVGAGAVGAPFPGVEAEVREGLVHVRSDMLFSGYLGADGALTGGPDADGWLTVGDRGELRDGRLFLAGRASETIVYGGLKVEPVEVERALAELPGVAAVACVGLPDERLGAIPVVALVLDPVAASPSRADVRALARERLPQPSRPQRVFVLDALPRSPRGKLDRAAVVARVLAGDARELL